jgi:hypothetical protein
MGGAPEGEVPYTQDKKGPENWNSDSAWSVLIV